MRVLTSSAEVVPTWATELSNLTICPRSDPTISVLENSLCPAGCTELS